jgi:PBP4 family serine-type D-alanyl-D-alanine carboxypeptidase
VKKVISLLSLFSLCAISYAGEHFPTDSLERTLRDIFVQSKIGGTYGLHVWSVQRRAELADQASEQLFRPASTGKLIVTAAALDAFAPAHKFTTQLEVLGERQGRTLLGAIKVIGKGDPGPSGRYYKDAWEPLRQWADTLKAWGIDTLQGAVLADDSFYPDPHRPDTWEKSFFNDWYGAEVAALAWNENLSWMYIQGGSKAGQAMIASVRPNPKNYIDLRVSGKTTKRGYSPNLGRNPETNQMTLSGNIGRGLRAKPFRFPVRNPTEYFRLALSQALEDRGIVLVNDSNFDPKAELKRLKIWEFPGLSLEQTVTGVNQRSHNLYAEMLLRNLGFKIHGTASVKEGLAAEQKFLSRLGLSPRLFGMVDGSGLSYHNRIAPKLHTRLLDYMTRHPRGSLYIKSLAAPGIGSGGGRMSGMATAQETRFKTGFVDQTLALAGYIFSSEGDTLTVSLLLNGYRANDSKARGTIDRMWGTIVQWMNREKTAYQEMTKTWRSIRLAESWDSRILQSSKTWLSRRHLPNALGEGIFGDRHKAPMARTDAFDSRSYIEHVLAVASSPTDKDLAKTLNAWRYYGSKVDYRERKHLFVSDFVRGNPQFKPWAPAGAVKTLRIENKKALMSRAGIPFDGNNPRAELQFLPTENALQMWAGPWTGPNRVVLLGFVQKGGEIAVQNAGFLILEKEQIPKIRIADAKAARVIEVPANEYLQNNREFYEGAALWEILPPKAFKGSDLFPTSKEIPLPTEENLPDFLGSDDPGHTGIELPGFD